MLIVPFIVGVVLRSRAGEPGGAWLIPLAAAEFAAYFAFNALGLWLHAAPARRAGFRPALITYTAITAVTAVLVIVLGGRPLLGWLPVALPLMAWAIWQASRKQDRSVTSGLATVALAVGMGVVIRFTSPSQIVSSPEDALRDIAVFVALFGYYAGTVWHVKSLIREWGNRQTRRDSIIWHVAFMALTTAAAAAKLLTPAWPVFFAVCTARTWWLSAPPATRSTSNSTTQSISGSTTQFPPHSATAAETRRVTVPPATDPPPRRPRPLQIGLLEIAMSVAALVIAIS